jgi:hypothetical protein
MDIHACIDYLGLNANQYKLDQSVPPHVIVEWNGNDPQPTDAELEAAWVEVQKLQYKSQRAVAYPSIAEQLDQIYHEGIDAWKETIAAVKAEYPKP